MYGNVYTNPQKFGLTIVYTCNFSKVRYSFDMRVVWRDITGSLWTARDEGCSCPVPFDHYTAIAELEPLPRGFTDFKSLDPEDYR